MKKVIIALAIIGVLGIAAVVGIGVFIDNNIESGIEFAVETGGGKVTGTDVKLDDVKLSIMNGKASLNGFYVMNPDGFSKGHAMKVDEVTVQLDLNSLASDAIVIKQILIDGAEIAWEGSLKGSNLTRIKKNIDKFIGEPKVEDSKDEDGEVKVIIDEFIMKNTSAKVSATLLKGKGQTVTLTDLELKSIGRDSGGATPEEVLGKIMPYVFKEIAKVGATVGVGAAAAGPLGAAVAVPVKEGAVKATKALKTGASKAGEAVKTGVSKATEAVKKLNIFKK
jgi:uncharacterized glyoxalase superfamily protein PhnB